MSDTYSTNTGGKTQVFSPGEHNQYIYPACNELLLSDEDVAKYLTYGATHVDNKRLENLQDRHLLEVKRVQPVL